MMPLEKPFPHFDISTPKKLRDFPFNDLPRFCGLSIFVDGKEVAMDLVGTVLKNLPAEYADFEIESTNTFFDTFVIRLKSNKEEVHHA